MSATSITSLDVAAAIVEKLHPMQIVRLQKLVYFAAGEYAALTAERLFSEEIEAWDLGPVVYDLWKTYKSFESPDNIDPTKLGDPAKLNDLALGCVDSVVAKYGKMSGAQLIDLTHQDPAWINSYVAGQGRTPISFDLLIESFRKRQAAEEGPSDELLDRVFAAQIRA